jgi:DNA-directed RNA polymerase specialized sigma24 family protein
MATWESALAELVTMRGVALKRYAFLLCGSDAEADDLVQDALVKRSPGEDATRSRTWSNTYAK